MSPLIDFLAFLGTKLWTKNSIFQEFPSGLARISPSSFQYFCHNFRTRNARKSIKPCKDSYYSLLSNKNSSQKNGFWCWRPRPDETKYA